MLLALLGTTLFAQDDDAKDLKKFRIINIGFVVNTDNLEYAPTITADGRTLYFVSERAGGVGGHDFWVTTKKERLDTIFTSPTNLSRPVNTELNEGVASIAADGQTIYFTACERPDGVGDCDIYEAELEGNEWKNVRNVTEINSARWDSQPSISSDGNTLYFVSNRPGSIGGDDDADIYVSHLGKDGKWSAPRNLGAPINTAKKEDSPFILAGGKVLYFSSAGHGGEGGLDFFTAAVNSDGTFGAPENLGPPFNTSRDERFITLPAAGDVVYFSSERDDMPNAGRLDIFMGLLPPKVINVLVKGRVFDLCTGGNLVADLNFTNAATGEVLQTVKTNAATGEYSFVIPGGPAMTINVAGTSGSYPSIASTINVPETKVFLEIVKDFPLGEQPRLSTIIDTSDYVKSLASSTTAKPKYKQFLGLLIEENLVKELYPLLTYVFFDSGSATIPNRYTLFTDPSQTAGFDDSKIPGGTLEKYRHVLNIIGYRLKMHPETKITIGGYDTEQPEIGETKSVAEQRAQIVYNYLMNIWQIDPSRVKMVPSGGLPKFKSNMRDPLGITENRRTEILSDDWEIMKPIVQQDFRRGPDPTSMKFEMKNGIADNLVARRAIEIKRHGQIWYVMTDVGTTTAISPDFNWGRGANRDSIPNDETPYTAQLVIYSRDGKECRSPEVEIPVLIVSNEVKRREYLVDETRDIYSLVLFKFDSPEAGPLNERILKEFIYNDVRQGAKIAVTGYTDIVGLEDRNLKLSKDRAATVTNGIRKNVKSSLIASIVGDGVGETSPLYNNDLPEGRFYNRTVQVRIVTPTVLERP
jgi:outer membrane protein OmpA-like peptidoglycan-associated protein